MNDLEQIRDELLFIADGCLVPPDGGSPDIYDAMASAKRALIALDRMIETPAPQGWKLVPIEPTEEMSLTFRREWQDMDIRGKLRSEMFKAAYKAMLSAAPTPAPTEKVDEWSRAEKLKEDLWFLSNAYKFSESEKERVNRMNTCIDHLANTGRLKVHND